MTVKEAPTEPKFISFIFYKHETPTEFTYRRAIHFLAFFYKH